jgi:hypothetical protein
MSAYANPPIVIKGGSFRVEIDNPLTHTAGHPGQRTHHYDNNDTVTKIHIIDGANVYSLVLVTKTWTIELS